jgi:hypothetical protein
MAGIRPEDLPYFTSMNRKPGSIAKEASIVVTETVKNSEMTWKRNSSLGF